MSSSLNVSLVACIGNALCYIHVLAINVRLRPRMSRQPKHTAREARQVVHLMLQPGNFKIKRKIKC